MPLVAPNLDTRTFEQIIAEVRRRIPTFTPEWTDLNDSDPGITLAQLFAFMSEQLIFQVNQVPNKGFITFLKMVGVELHPAVPATADITFLPVGGTNPGAPYIVEIDERTQVQTSAPPPGQTTPLTFETIRAFTAINGSLVDIVTGNWDLQYTSQLAVNASITGTYLPLNQAATTRDSFFLVLDLNVAAGSPPWPAAAFRFRVNVPQPANAPAGTTDVGEPTNSLPAGSTPRIAWSYSTGTQTVSGTQVVTFTSITPSLDSTLELTQSGYLEFTFNAADVVKRATPPGGAPALVPSNFLGRFVLRAQVLSPNSYGSSPPRLASILLNTVTARNLVTVRNEPLGVSNGQRFQSFTLANAPVYPGSSVITVYEASNGAGTFVPWAETLDLFSAGPTDRVYELVPDSGEIIFGDGTTGMIPPPDDGSQPTGNLVVTSYQYGGGLNGNVGATSLTKVIGNTGVVSFDANNVLPAAGGDDEESPADGVARAPAVVRSRYRAVSVSDFEALAQETPNTRVARANALANTRPGHAYGTTPGAVTVVLVPDAPFAASIAVPIGLPSLVARDVHAYLDQRRLITAELYTSPATFRQVTVTASIRLAAGSSASVALGAALTALNTYFHALVGGDDGLGWPFGGTIHFSRVFQILLDVPSVALVETVSIALDSGTGVSCADVPVNPGELLYSGPHQVLGHGPHVTVHPRVHLPDLTGPEPPPTPSGWMKLRVQLDPASKLPLVHVPSRDDARRCAASLYPGGACTPTVISFDPPDGTTLIALGGASLSVHVHVTPGVADGDEPLLTLQALSTGAAIPSNVTFAGRVEGACRERIVFPSVITAATANGPYVLSLVGYAGPTAEITVALGPSPPPGLPLDRCALTLAPGRAAAGVALLTPPSAWPSPPLLAVDAQGCIVAAWSVHAFGWVLVPRADGGVDLLQSCRGGVRARIREKAPIVDAIFWQDTIAVLTSVGVALYDLGGCPILPAAFSMVFTAAVALGISDENFLIVIDSKSTPNVMYFRRDGSRFLAPAAFDSRGWYARHRSPAFVISDEDGRYAIVPGRAATATPPCNVAATRALTDAEALLFEMIDDLPDLRERFAYPVSGWVVLGAAQTGDLLDAGRAGTQWHRILLFGQIPAGCAVGIETRSFDDPLIAELLLADDPQSAAQGWSPMVVVDAASAGPVEAPGDLRTAVGDAMVLAGPGRFLWIRLTLQSDGRSTPRILSIEAEQPRLGISRYLPKVFRDSTPQDDFLRRWLALFEETGFRGIAARMDAYAEIFDPRTAPEPMLPYLAGWLEIPLFPDLVADPARLRRVLTRANDIAESRGTIDGLVLVAKLYLGITLQIVESHATRSRFVLGLGQTLLGCTGPILGADTVLTMERAPTYLGDGPTLGSSYLYELDDRDGAIAYHFDVLVPARQVCSSEDLSLLRSLIETEKPAYTTYSIRLVAPAGWVLGLASVVGQNVKPSFDRRTLDPTTYGLAILNGPPRPKPIGLGFTLGHDARLTAPTGPPQFQLEATVGRTTRLGA